MTYKSQCLDCKNFINDKNFGCKAFPKIPHKILFNDFIHDKKFPGQDNDILFEKKKSVDK